MAKSLFDLDEFKDLKESFAARRSRFRDYWRYFKAEYNGGNSVFASAPSNYLNNLFQASIKPIFTPLARAVRIDAALIPGEWKLDKNNAQHEAALARLFRMSKWDTEGDLWVKFAAAMGESAIRIVDDRLAQTVRLMPMRPDTYITRSFSFYDQTPRQLISIYEQQEGGKDVEYAEVIDAATVRTFRNGEPYAMNPAYGAEYANALGFVPVVVCLHDNGEGQGEATFDDVLTALDQVNQQATYMAQIIERHFEPQWAAFGAEPGDLEKSGDSVWFFPEGSDIKAILAQVDFEGLLAFIKEIKTEMKESLPELAFAKLVGVERVAAATIELQMAEAVFKIRSMRKAHDQALAEAVMLAGRAATGMGNELAGLDDPMLAFDKNRPVITIDALTRLQIEQQRESTELARMAREREAMLTSAMQGDETPDA